MRSQYGFTVQGRRIRSSFISVAKRTHAAPFNTIMPQGLYGYNSSRICYCWTVIAAADVELQNVATLNSCVRCSGLMIRQCLWLRTRLA